MDLAKSKWTRRDFEAEIVEKAASFSDDGRYRWSLSREIPYSLSFEGVTDGVVVFCMLNPSTADAAKNDPTITRCMNYARAWGGRNLYVVNAYAFRSTNPGGLWRYGIEASGNPWNDKFIRAAARLAFYGRGVFVCGWGGNIKRARQERVLSLVRAEGATPMALGVTRGGNPRHPLYMKKDAHPKPF